jgi:hypothetical protein
MWTLAILVPSPLSAYFRQYEDPSYTPLSDNIFHIIPREEQQPQDHVTVKDQRHFARLGFLQAGRSPALAEFFFATGDSFFNGRGDPWDRLLSRDQVKSLDLYTKPAPHRMKEVDMELGTLLEPYASAPGDVAFQQCLLMANVMRTDRFSTPSESGSELLSKIRDLVLDKGASIN